MCFDFENQKNTEEGSSTFTGYKWNTTNVSIDGHYSRSLQNVEIGLLTKSNFHLWIWYGWLTSFHFSQLEFLFFSSLKWILEIQPFPIFVQEISNQEQIRVLFLPFKLQGSYLHDCAFTTRFVSFHGLTSYLMLVI